MNKRDFNNDHLPTFLASMAAYRNFTIVPPAFTTVPPAFTTVPPAAAIRYPKFSPGGLFHRRYTYIDYAPKRIRYALIVPGREIAISDLFSGCAMAYFNHNRNWYVAHICLTGVGNRDDRGKQWNAFIRAECPHIHEYAIFKPYGANRTHEIIQKNLLKGALLSAVGIITPDLRCYAAVTDNNYNPLEIIEIRENIHISNNLSVESFLPNFLIPDNRTNW